MAYTTIDDPEAYFQAVTYTGNGSADHAITLDGDTDMQPDLVWIKNRVAADAHCLFDSVRGVTVMLQPNDTSGEATDTDTLDAFQSDGFRTDGDNETNTNTEAYVAWCWKGANGTASNSTGDLTSTVSANTTSKFSIVSWTAADAGAAKTVGHGLGVVPEFIIVKQRNRTVNWPCYIEAIGNTNTMWLDTTDASSVVDYWNDTSPTTSLFTTNALLEDAYNNIAYCFAPVQGFSKFGKYTGNGNADGPFIHLGFRPAWIMTKITSGVDNWQVCDNKRDTDNAVFSQLNPDSTDAQNDGDAKVDFLSNGFKIRKSGGSWNGSGSTFVYMAFAEAPFVNSNGVPCNAR